MTKLRICILISGGGTTLKNLLDKINNEALPVEICRVISSNPSARGLRYAEEAGIASSVIEKDENAAEQFRDAIFGQCREDDVEYVVMGGFIKHVLIPDDFENRVINIHPSLIPAFCGKGYYGQRVHQEVLKYGAKVSGCTVHFVDNQFDHGPIILQRTVDVLPDDTADELQRRVFGQECVALPDALRALAEKRVEVQDRSVVVR